MPEELMLQPGTFSSISKTTTFHPLRNYQYLVAGEVISCIILTIMLIAPVFIMMIVSKFIVITPDVMTAIIATFTDPQFRIPMFIVAFVMDVLCIFTFIVRAPVKIILSKEGILYSDFIYRIYSPWENVIGIENVKYSIVSLKGLKLNKEFQHGPTIEEGQQQGYAVFEYKTPFLKKYSRKGARLYFSVEPGVNTFPLIAMSNKKRVKKKLVAAIRLYAPSILTRQIN